MPAGFRESSIRHHPSNADLLGLLEQRLSSSWAARLVRSVAMVKASPGNVSDSRRGDSSDGSSGMDSADKSTDREGSKGDSSAAAAAAAAAGPAASAAAGGGDAAQMTTAAALAPAGELGKAE